MALRNHHGDVHHRAAELDDTSSGTGIGLLVPRDADPAALQAEFSKLPGLEGIHTDYVRSQGFCLAQFDSQATARHAHDTIMNDDCRFGPYLVQCFYVDQGAAQTHSAWSGSPSDHLRLPETLYETGPLTQQMPPLTSPRTAFKDPPCPPVDSGSQRGPSSLTSTMTPQSNGTTVGGAGGPAGGFWSPPLSLTGGAGASAPNSSGANGGSSQLALLAQQRLAQHSGAAQPLYDTAPQRYASAQHLAQMFQNLSTSQEDFPGSGGPPDVGAGVRGLPSQRTTAFPTSSLPFDSEGIPSTGSGASSNWPGRAPCGTPSAYPPQNLPPGMTGSGYAGLREVGSGGASHAYGMPPPPFAPHAQHLPSNSHTYQLDMGGPQSADDFPAGQQGSAGAGGSAYGGWQGHMASPQGGGGGNAERSKQRLFVVVSKSATEEQIAKQFKKFGGMEYCNLKRDKRTGASKGYCFVNFSTAESAAAAMAALNGIEFPTGSGKNLRVEYSEVLPSARQGMPMSSRPSSTNSHGSGAFKTDGGGGGAMFDGHMPPPSPYPPKGMHDPRPPRSQEHPGSGPQHPNPERPHGMAYAGNITDFVASHNFDPSSGMFASAVGGNPASGSRGAGTARSRGEAASVDPCRLFVHVSPHLPEHAVRHLFEGYGTVLSLLPLEDDACFWVVRFEDAAAAAAATSNLNGLSVLGSGLTVEPSDSVNGALRPRFLAVSSISTYSSHYPSSRGPSSQGISSTGSMQAAALGGKMQHYYDAGGRGIGSGGSHFPQHAHASPARLMPQVVEGGGIRGTSAAAAQGARNGSGSLPSSGQSPSPQLGGYVHF